MSFNKTMHNKLTCKYWILRHRRCRLKSKYVFMIQIFLQNSCRENYRRLKPFESLQLCRNGSVRDVKSLKIVVVLFVLTLVDLIGKVSVILSKTILILPQSQCYLWSGLPKRLVMPGKKNTCRLSGCPCVLPLDALGEAGANKLFHSNHFWQNV